MNAELRQTAEALREELPFGWGVRERRPSGGGSLEVYHSGEAGGGVLLTGGRSVTLIGPSLDHTGASVGPCPGSIFLGEFVGQGWRDRLVAQVLTAIRLFREKWPHAVAGRPFDAIYTWARRAGACSGALRWLLALETGSGKAEELLAICPRGDWILWAAAKCGAPECQIEEVSRRAVLRAVREHAGRALSRLAEVKPGTLDRLAFEEIAAPLLALEDDAELWEIREVAKEAAERATRELPSSRSTCQTDTGHRWAAYAAERGERAAKVANGGIGGQEAAFLASSTAGFSAIAVVYLDRVVVPGGDPVEASEASELRRSAEDAREIFGPSPAWIRRVGDG